MMTVNRLSLILEKRSIRKMTNEVREQEVWRQYPDPKYPFVEASNLGRIRTKDRTITDKNGKKRFVRGRILKQQVLPNGYMQVPLSVNGKTVHRYVHRIEAASFIPNPDNLPEVNHKDNDRTNNAISNLEWCTSQYNNNYKKNFGTSSTEVLGHPTFAVDLRTSKILRFESQCEAAHQLGVYQGNIQKVLNGEKSQTGGYWFTEDESKITEEKIKEIRAKMQPCQVIAVNFKTGEVFWFESQREAARQLGINQASIGRIANGQQNRAGDYWFCDADETAVEKTRNKFGDEIANKVKELM